MTRATKKSLIAIIFFLIIGLLGWGIYSWIKPASTCFDGIQNQGEEGIDCGGPCSSCPPVISDLEVLDASVIWQKDLKYDLFAKIRNPNLDFGASSLKYQFVIYDSKGEEIKREEGKNYILPNQGKYIIKNNIELSEVPSKIKFSLKEINWQRLKDFTPLSLPTYDRVLSEKEGITQLSGIIENQTNYDWDRVEITAVLFDSLENPVAVRTHEIRTLLSSQKRFFQITWPQILTDKTKSIEIEASTDVFLEDNYLKHHGTQEKWQQYQ